MRRTGLAAAAMLAALTLSGAGAVVIPVGSAGPDCSAAATAALSYTCSNLMIPVNSDGAKLDATFYVPKSASPSARVPAILMTHGYGGWHRSGGDIGAATSLAGAGYAVLAYTSRGFGRSEGTVQLQAPEWEVRDAMDLISWLATPAKTGDRIIIDDATKKDPRIGMYGGSYAGGIQLLTAAWDPGHRLDAIVPLITWNDLRYSLAPNGVVHHGWIDLLFASGLYAGYLGPLGSVPPPVISTEGVPVDQPVQILSTYLTNDSTDIPGGYSDGSHNSYEYLLRRSVAPVISNVTTPTFLIQGQRDTLFTINEALRNLAGISTPVSDKKLLVYSAGHGYGALPGESDAIQARVLAWFAHYLKKDATPTGPSVESWRPWIDTPLFDFGTPGAATATPVTLAGPATSTLVNLIAPTSHSEVTNFQSQLNTPAVDLLPGVTSQDWTSPVAADTYLFGGPILHFTISSAAPEAIVFAKLWDSGPSGRTLIHRQVSPVRVRGGVGDFCANHIPPLLDVTASVAPTAVCLAMQPIVWKLPAGHSLVLTLATSDTMFFSSRFPGVYSVSGVSLEIPVVPAF